MSDTYTGTIDPSLSLTAQVGQVFPDDRQGTLVEINSSPAPTVDDIFYFNGPSGNYLKRVIDGPIRAAQCGIYPGDAVNAALRLQAALDHPDITTIIFDYSTPTDIEIDDADPITVPAGKVLQFMAGNRLTGTATIEGGIIDAPDTQECFEATMNVRPTSSTKPYYSAKWFGVKGDGSTPDSDAIQKIFNYFQESKANAKPLYFPKGSYKIDKALIVYLWVVPEPPPPPAETPPPFYAQTSIDIFGEYDTRSGIQEPMTKFVAAATEDMAESFILGIQKGRAVTIRNIMFVGQYTPEFATEVGYTELDLFRSTADDWLVDGIRDEKKSPYCAINIDPFSRTVPANDEGYQLERLEGFYRGSDQGGSSQVVMHGCRFEHFPVGVACSINGDTKNAEIIKIEQCSFAFNKVAYALGQDQTKENLMIDVRVWEVVRTIIDCSNYGEGAGAPPYIMGMNIAGAVYQLILSSAPFSLYASKIFAEMLFRIGKLNSSANVHSIIESDIDFPRGDVGYPSADFIVSGSVNFVNCSIRYYDGGFQRLKLCPPNTAGLTIKGGTISRLPLTSSISPANDIKYINLDQVRIYGENHTLLAGTDNAQIIGFNLLKNTPLCGNVKTSNAAGSEGTLYFSYEKNTYDAIAYLDDVSVTVSENGNASLTLSSDLLELISPGDYLISSGDANFTYWEDVDIDPMPVLGRITTIVGTTVNLQGAAINIPLGTTPNVPVYVNYIRYFNAPIVGDLTDDSDTITNCEFFYDHTPSVGMRLEHPFIDPGVYITAVNTGAKTITLSRDAKGTQADATIINGSPNIQHIIRFAPAVSTLKGYLIEGAEMIVDRETIYSRPSDKYYVTKSVLSSSSSRALSYFPTTGGFQRINIATLRFGAGPTDTNTCYFITDAGKEGVFILDSADTTTADNGATVLVANTARFKRILTNNFYNGRWFGKSNIYFDSVSDANTNIGAAYRFKSLTVLIDFSGIVKEYWYYNGTADADLVLKAQSDVDAFSTTMNTSRTVAANTMATYIMVKASNAGVTNFIVGTSSMASDVVPATALPNGTWKVFNTGVFFESAGSLFFGGINGTGATCEIKILKMLLT